MHEHRYVSGSWWIICDSCAKKIRSEETFHRWDGFVVCGNCFEERHPQDFIRARVDKITVPFTRPRGEDVFVEFTVGEGIEDILNNTIPSGTFNNSL